MPLPVKVFIIVPGLLAVGSGRDHRHRPSGLNEPNEVIIVVGFVTDDIVDLIIR
jgi:hypothetical protein